MSYNYYKFTFADSSYLILCDEQRYARTESGRSWKRKPDTIETHVYRAEQYQNCVQSVQWFKNVFGARNERAEWGYTRAGYLPIKITSVSPDGAEKVVYSFKFAPLDRMEAGAGWRENEILKKAHSFEIERYATDRGSVFSRLTLKTSDSGVTAAGTFDFGRMAWVN